MSNDVAEEMKHSARRLLADTDHDRSLSGQQTLNRLKPGQRLDLFLFYKECLANIVQHARATRVHTRLTVDSSQVELTVEDNGIGTGGETPKSLRRRAKLLRAQVESTALESEGTRICLTFKPKRGLFK